MKGFLLACRKVSRGVWATYTTLLSAPRLRDCRKRTSYLACMAPSPVSLAIALAMALAIALAIPISLTIPYWSTGRQTNARQPHRGLASGSHMRRALPSAHKKREECETISLYCELASERTCCVAAQQLPGAKQRGKFYQHPRRYVRCTCRRLSKTAGAKRQAENKAYAAARVVGRAWCCRHWPGTGCGVATVVEGPCEAVGQGHRYRCIAAFAVFARQLASAWAAPPAAPR